MKSVTAVLAAFATVLLLAAPTQAAPVTSGLESPAAAAAPGQAASDVPAKKKYRRSTQRAVNRVRDDEGRARIDFAGQRCLRKAARSYIRRMAEAGGMLPHNLDAVSKDCKAPGLKELIGVGFTSGAKLVEAWMATRPKVVLNAKLRVGAVEAVKGDDGHWYAIMLASRK